MHSLPSLNTFVIRRVNFSKLGFYFPFIFYGLRRRRRDPVPTVAHHQHWNVHDLQKSTHTAQERRNHSLQPWPTLILLWCTPSFRLPELFKKTKRHTTKRRNTLISKKAQKCLNCNKIEGFRQANSNSKECARSLQTTSLSDLASKILACHSHSFFFFDFSHHIPLLCCCSPHKRLLLLLQLAFHTHNPLTLPQDNLPDTANAVNKENPATLSYPNTSFTSWQRRSMVMWQLKATLPREKERHHLACSILPNDFNSPALVVVLIHLTAKGGFACRARADPFWAFRANLPPHVHLNRRLTTTLSDCCQKV